MTDTTEMTEMIDPVTGEIIDQKQLAEQLLAQAKAQGMSLVGPGGFGVFPKKWRRSLCREFVDVSES